MKSQFSVTFYLVVQHKNESNTYRLLQARSSKCYTHSSQMLSLSNSKKGQLLFLYNDIHTNLNVMLNNCLMFYRTLIGFTEIQIFSSFCIKSECAITAELWRATAKIVTQLKINIPQHYSVHFLRIKLSCI